MLTSIPSTKETFDPEDFGPEKLTAPNSCVNCVSEPNCGYSPLAGPCKERSDSSYHPCCLGLMSSGSTFFEPKR